MNTRDVSKYQPSEKEIERAITVASGFILYEGYPVFKVINIAHCQSHAAIKAIADPNCSEEVVIQKIQRAIAWKQAVRHPDFRAKIKEAFDI